MNRIIVCGSIAFDNIMDFPGLFKDQILSDKIHALNVSFLVNTLKKVRGGTAPNIAYNLSLIGQKPEILGTAGSDFYEYKNWLNKKGVNTCNVRILEDDYTASCFITTDLSNNQIISFYPGAMAKDHELTFGNIDKTGIGIVIIAPTDPVAMIKWAKECRALNIPYLFDPGMQIPRLTGEELKEGILGSKIAIFNEYEYSIMLDKTRLSKDEILSKVDLVVETLGERGSILRTKNERVHVPAAKPREVVDPTGAGDAYRAGLLKGYFEGAGLEIMGKYASVTSVYAIEHKGGTEHSYTMEEFNKRYNENFGGNKL